MFVAHIIILDHTSGKIILFFMVKPILFPTQKNAPEQQNRSAGTAPRLDLLQSKLEAFDGGPLRRIHLAIHRHFVFCEWTHFTIKDDI